MLNRENYIVIKSFMVTDLGLKGNELLIYAIIYGFTQDNENWFTGSLSYLAEWTNSTKQGVLNNLKSLVEKQLIIKEDVFKNNIKFCQYKTNFDGIKKSLIPIKESLTGVLNKVEQGIKKSLINSIDNNIDNKIEDIIKPKSKNQIPTKEEIKEYLTIQGIANINIDDFIRYYEAVNWEDNYGNIINWKQKLILWKMKAKEKGTQEFTQADRYREAI